MNPFSRRTLLLVPLMAAAESRFDVRQSGAAGDGERLDTAAIQSAIDRCAKAGGGVVSFPPGRYLSGTLFLRDRVTLVLEAGAVLLGSPRLADYPVCKDAVRSYTSNYTERCLIRAESVHDAGIRGAGEIDGNGEAFAGEYKVRPFLIRFVSCSGVRVEEVTIRNSPMWVQHYLDCEDVRITGIRVRSRRKRVNNDGIDIDSCRRVRISDCDIDAGDDAIVLKATMNVPCRDVVVTNCILSSLCNAFKLGTESNGGFDNVVFSNSVIRDTGLAGIALESVDGGALRRVGLSNIVMRDVGCPVFVRLGNRARPVGAGEPQPGRSSVSGITLRDINAVSTSPVACSITGLPGMPVEDITIDGLRILAPGGGTRADVERAVPERPEAYPEFSMFGALPAAGLYCRHARNIKLNDVSLRTVSGDVRSPLFAEDVEGLLVSRMQGDRGSGGRSLISLRDARDVRVEGTRPASPTQALLSLSGGKTADVLVRAEQDARAELLVDESVAKGAWRVSER